MDTYYGNQATTQQRICTIVIIHQCDRVAIYVTYDCVLPLIKFLYCDKPVNVLSTWI